MPYVQNGQVVENKNIWRLESISELFWKILSLITLL